jgi:pimeloyl-ACP methyl ester carboxylesterase
MPPVESSESFAEAEFQLLSAGEGPPLLYLHGGNGGGVWYRFLDELSAEYSVLAPEHPGFGRAEPPAWLEDIGDLAYFYLEWLEARGVSEVRVVASSIGGWLALEIALRDASRLHSLALLAPAGVRAPGVSRPDAFLWNGADYAANLFHDPSLARRPSDSPPSLEEQALGARNRSAVARLGWSPRMHGPSLEKWISRIRLPSIVICGAEDRVQPAAQSIHLSERLPNARVAVIPECGHLPAIETPKTFLQLFRAFQEEIAR